jgi:3-hydroxyisobutyrate dehydrogenase-like beta-hydroxyacid dehydrogenase
VKVAFIGLGSMGAPIARNLLDAGHALTVYNRTPGRAKQLVAQGAREVASSARAATGADAVVTMLADDPAVVATVLDGGVLQALPSGAVHVSMSTISPALSRRLAEAHRAAGQAYVAAPVFGRPDAAAAKRLWIIAAGPADALAAARPILDAVGQEVLVVGDDPAAANVVKIAGNFLLAAVIEGIGESFALVRKHGIAPERFLEIVNGKVLRSPIYESYGALIAAERYEPAGFKLKHGLKDIRLALQAGDEVAVPLPLASLMRDHYLSAVARGWEEIDWAALAKVSAVNAGLTERGEEGRGRGKSEH